MQCILSRLGTLDRRMKERIIARVPYWRGGLLHQRLQVVMLQDESARGALRCEEWEARMEILHRFLLYRVKAADRGLGKRTAGRRDADRRRKREEDSEQARDSGEDTMLMAWCMEDSNEKDDRGERDGGEELEGGENNGCDGGGMGEGGEGEKEAEDGGVKEKEYEGRKEEEDARGEEEGKGK
eukprot:Sspe_Gene.14399::Locus_4985_Transcript_1_1_Confidence_1.000_Length_823::g.14399::m.14399